MSATLIQQSTTTEPLLFFLVSSTDHITSQTGASPTVKISKSGAAGAAPAGAVTEVDSTNVPGWYQVAANSVDANTLGQIILHATHASTDPCDMIVGQVVSFNPRNANLGFSHVSANVDQINGATVTSATGQFGVNVVNFAGSTVTGRDIGASVLLSAGTGTGQLDFTSGVVKANATQIAGSAVDTTSPQLGVRVNNIVANAVDTTSAQLGVRLVNIGASAVNTTSAQLGVNLVNISGAAVTSASAQIGANVVSIASGAVTSTAFTTDAIGSTQLAATAVVKISDGLLDRDMSVGADSGTTTVRTVRQALRFLRNKWSIAAGTLTICKEDDTATSWTAAVTTDSTALPIVTNDPAG